MANLDLNIFDANIEELAPAVARWEGGYVNDPLDRGGATNMGVTIGTWKLVGHDKNNDGVIDEKDIRILSKEDFKFVLQKYWDKWKADEIKSQSVANILVDWYWMSGSHGIVIPQRLLGVVPDGIVGPLTIAAVNNSEPKRLFDTIKNARIKFYNDLVSTSIRNYEKRIGRKSTQSEQLRNTQMKYYKGWINRLNSFKFSV